MANEAVIIETYPYNVRRYNCISGASFTKGQLLKLADPKTASGSYIGVGDPFAGIVAFEKTGVDGSTDISCYTSGIFELTMALNATCMAGELVIMSGTNLIVSASSVGQLLSGAIVGKALEAGASSEVIQVAVGSII